MCEKTVAFECFEDGQIPASMDCRKDSLPKDPSGALSVCRKQIESLPPFSNVQELFEQRCNRVKGGLREIVHGTEVAMGGLPRAQGFFTSTTDRASAYRTACGFFELFQKTLSGLAEESLGISGLYAVLKEREMAIFSVQDSVESMQRAAKRAEDQAAVQQGEVFLQILAQHKAEDLAFLTRVKKLECSLEHFCAHTCREFCRFAAAKADMEHEGAGASPAELSRLLWGLRGETERLLKEI